MSKHTPDPALDPQLSGAPDDAAGKALRAETHGEGGGVFRLDALAPGAAASGTDAFAAGKKAKVSQSALFFLVLVIAGALVLFFMRQVGFGPMASLAKVKAPDYDVTKDLKGKSGDHKRVLQDLSESSVKTQVPIEQVQKNPFKLSELVNTNPDQIDDPEKAQRVAAELARREAEARKRQIESALANLKLHSVIGGSTPVARINDTAVRIGDTIEEVFVVRAIEGRTVELDCDGEVFTISMDEPGASPVKGSRRR